MDRGYLFGNTSRHECRSCHKQLPLTYSGDLCPSCEEIELFARVKEFIRSRNDVKEQDVVEKFGIPKQKVRKWIREGRIEYCVPEEGQTVFGKMYEKCEMCGKPIEFGTMCRSCYSQNRGRGVMSNQGTQGKFRHEQLL